MKNIYILFSLFLLSLFNTSIQAQTSQTYYLDAFNEIDLMLSTNSMNFKKAVYLTENAYLEGQIDKNAFNNAIQFYASICEEIAISGDINYTGKRHSRLFGEQSFSIKNKDIKHQGYKDYNSERGQLEIIDEGYKNAFKEVEEHAKRNY